jgi:hypothetical protein
MGKLATLLTKLDPGQIRRRFPSEEQYERFNSAKKLAQAALERAEGGLVSEELLKDIEAACSELRALANELADTTEIKGKSTLNEAYYLAEAGYLERSIHLAGIVASKPLNEPYRTQIRLLPADACLYRYRQVQLIERIVREQEQEIAPALELVLDQMATTLLAQMDYFAREAYARAQLNPHAAYMKALANLLKAHEVESRVKRDSQGLVASASEIVAQIQEPNHRSHYMTLQYHRRNFEEFRTFQRLSGRHSRIRGRLEDLHDQAVRLEKDGHGIRPKEWFAFGPYLTLGARAASIIGLVSLVGGISGMGPDELAAGVRSVWDTVVAQVPGIDSQALMSDSGTNGHLLAGHNGGPARFMDIVFSHNGGPA